MKVSELIEELMSIDPDAVVVVGCELISGIEVVTGRINRGHYNDRFSTGISPHKARDTALCFTRWEELSSSSEIREVRI